MLGICVVPRLFTARYIGRGNIKREARKVFSAAEDREDRSFPLVEWGSGFDGTTRVEAGGSEDVGQYDACICIYAS